jgi:hypothetical protein
VTALAIASPVLGGPSLKSLVKKEVAKQISKATGPPGAAGTAGAAGANGTARAYAEVSPRGSGQCGGGNPAPQPCSFDRAKGITSVIYTGVGEYCVVAPGIDPLQVPSLVSVDFSETDDPEGNAAVQSNTNCGTGFEVKTERWANPTNSAPSDTVAFDVLIP